MYNLFLLDVAFSPFDMFIIVLSELWWIIAIAAILVASAIVGIVYFTKKKNLKKGGKK